MKKVLSLLIIFTSICFSSDFINHKHIYSKWFYDTSSLYLPPVVIHECILCHIKQSKMGYYLETNKEQAHDPDFWNQVEKEIIKDLK
jgi:hypothetical protein